MPMQNSAVSADPHEVARRVGEFWRRTLPAWLRLNLDVSPILEQGLAELAATCLWGPANREPSNIMWQLASHVLQHGWLQLRAREKPRGYAGDHEMLGAIFQNRVTGDPLGKSFDHFFLRQAAPQAVRNRMDLVSHELESGKKTIFIGSGAGLEIATALERWPEKRKGEFWLLDLDPAAVELAEQNLRRFAPAENLHCLAENLVRLPKKRKLLEQLQGADLLICTGFFDYLEDEPAAELLKCCWQLLRPGGEALIFNFAPWNPTRAYMEWIGNWYLIYRTRDELTRLAEGAGLSKADFTVSAEVSGVDLLLRIRRT